MTIWSRLVFHLLGAKPQELNLRPVGANFAGGHPQKEVLHASPQHCVFSDLPQASVQPLHLPVFAFDVYRRAESMCIGS